MGKCTSMLRHASAVSTTSDSNYDVDVDALLKAAPRWHVPLTCREAFSELNKQPHLPRCPTVEHVELLVLLENPLGYCLLRNLAADLDADGAYALHCWPVLRAALSDRSSAACDLVAAQRLFSSVARTASGSRVFGAPNELDLHWSDDEDRTKAARRKWDLLVVPAFRKLLDQCLGAVLVKIYVPLRRPAGAPARGGYGITQRSAAYLQLCSALHGAHNRVTPSDFVYLHKLGSGALGVVVLCQRRSTGCLHAMKIQSKSILAQHFADAGTSWARAGQDRGVEVALRVAGEITVLKTCACDAADTCPFIAGLRYSLQTESLLLTVVEAGEAGDLYSLLEHTPGHRLPPASVQFYVAELAAALLFLHRRGFVHRDVKLENVVLRKTGHVMLTDFGCAMQLGPDEPVAPGSGGGCCSLPLLSDCGDGSLQGIAGTMSSWGTASRNVPSRPASQVLSSLCYPEDEGSSNNSNSNSNSNSGNGGSTGSRGGRMKAELDAAMATVAGSSSKAASKSPPMPVRRPSAVGSLDYLAPELLVRSLVTQSDKAASYGRWLQLCGLGAAGYSHGVDWWSLGVVMHVLATGQLPFPGPDDVCVVHLLSDPIDFHPPIEGDAASENPFRVYPHLDLSTVGHCFRGGPSARSGGDSKDEASDEHTLGAAAELAVTGFLTEHPVTRLGAQAVCSTREARQIRQHAYFASLDFDCLTQLTPPTLPRSSHQQWGQAPQGEHQAQTNAPSDLRGSDGIAGGINVQVPSLPPRGESAGLDEFPATKLQARDFIEEDLSDSGESGSSNGSQNGNNTTLSGQPLAPNSMRFSQMLRTYGMSKWTHMCGFGMTAAELSGGVGGGRGLFDPLWVEHTTGAAVLEEVQALADSRRHNERLHKKCCN